MTTGFKTLLLAQTGMDPPSLLPDPDPDEASEVIEDLEKSRWYSPDTEYEDRHFDTIYGLETRPSGKWKYDHRLGTHSILYDPEKEQFDVRTASPIEVLHNSISTITDHLTGEHADGTDITERFGYLLEDEDIDAYTSILRDSDLEQIDASGSTTYQGDEATVRVTERDIPEQGGRYADVEIEILEGGQIPGGASLLERQRSVSFDGDLDATLQYLETPSIYDNAIEQDQ